MVLGGAAAAPEVVREPSSAAGLDFAATGPVRRGRFNLIEAAGQHAGQRVSFHIAVSRDAGMLTQPDGIELRSDGAASDAFVRMLAKLYKLPGQTTLRMRASVPFAGYIFDGDPMRLAHSRMEFKLYNGTSSDAPGYCELYLNVDLPHQRIEWRDRDPGYRRVLLALLAQ